MAGYIGSKAVNLSTTGADINGDANIDGDLSFRDNDKAIFGAGSDLEIFHNGSSSIIQDTGSGGLTIRSNLLTVQNAAGNETVAQFLEDGFVKLFHNNSQVFTTISTGASITGSLGIGTSSPTGLLDLSATTGSGTLNIISTVNATNAGNKIAFFGANRSDTDEEMAYIKPLLVSNSGGSGNVQEGHLTFGTSGNEAMRIDSSGNVGIGTSSPSEVLELTAGATNFGLLVNNATGNPSRITLTNSEGSGYIDQNNNLMRFNQSGSVDISIDASGNVGIGTDSPTNPLHILSTEANQIVLEANSTTIGPNLVFKNTDGNLARIASAETNTLRFEVGPSDTEAMRIDQDGNLLVGKTAADVNTNGVEVRSTGKLNIRVDEGPALDVRRATASASEYIAVFRDSNTGMIKIGETGNAGFIEGATGDTGLKFEGAHIRPRDNQADADNAVDLGNSSFRFDDVYATNGTINTSDRNEKQDIAELSDAEQRVAVAAKGLMRKFRWRDAVAEKGDEARTHFGIIAQDLQAAFAAEGLDAGDYAMFISSTWTDEETGEERTRMGVRYSELLAFIIGAL